MIRRNWFTRMFAATAAALVVSGTASAGIIPISVTVTPEAGNFRWTYAIQLPTDMKLQAGDYFTIYDFGGYVDGSLFANPAADTGAWTMTTAKVAVPIGLNPNNDETIPDLTFKYTGPAVLVGGLGLGNFGASSTVGTSTATDFTAQNRQFSTNELDRNIVDTIAPGVPPIDPPSGVPEPTTLALAGIGLPLLAAARRFRNKA
jgi:hypothetical protein